MKALLFVIALFFCAAPCQGHILEELWDKYSGIAGESPEAQSSASASTPGVILGKAQGAGEAAFDYPWKFRSSAYEMHFEKPDELARSVYSLALFAHDVSPDIPPDKFYGGVLGFHYSTAQISAWLNNTLANGKSLSPAESRLAGRLLLEGILAIGPYGFEPIGGIKHVLGAAPGKKRSFATNLRHERLHVFWDENKEFQQEQIARWQALSDAEKANIRKELKNYAQDNEPQLIEEWAIKNAEKGQMPIK